MGRLNDYFGRGLFPTAGRMPLQLQSWAYTLGKEYKLSLTEPIGLTYTVLFERAY